MESITLDKMELAFVRDLARDVREWTEQLYFVRQQSDGLTGRPLPTLCGYCAIASAELWRRLRDQGIYSQLHVSYTVYGSHVYVVLEDHIVDVTATQFHDITVDHDQLYIRHARMSAHVYHQTTEIFETADDLRRFQRQGRWPKDQIALTENQTKQRAKTSVLV